VITEVAVHGAVPFSKLPLPITCPPVQPPVPVTVTVYVALRVTDPVPVTVMAYVPVVAVDEAATVMVAEPPEVTDEGLNETVTPLGAPDADKATVWAEPLVVAVLTVAVVGATRRRGRRLTARRNR
jgi:hypothetical protein